MFLTIQALGGITSEQINDFQNFAPLSRLSLFELSSSGHTEGVLDYGYYGTVNPSTGLSTGLGSLSGYFTRRWAGMGFQTLNVYKVPSLKWGVVYFYEKSGWSRQDYFWYLGGDIPSITYTNHFYGLSMRHAAMGLHASAGQYYSQKIESGSVSCVSCISTSGNWWYNTTWQGLNVSLISSGKSVSYYQSGFRPANFFTKNDLKFYLPELRFYHIGDEIQYDKTQGANHISLRQNLYQQLMFGSILYDATLNRPQTVLFEYHTELHQLAGVNFSYRFPQKGILNPSGFGFSLRAPLVTFGYNYFEDSDSFFSLENRFFLTFRLNLVLAGNESIMGKMALPSLLNGPKQ